MASLLSSILAPKLRPSYAIKRAVFLIGVKTIVVISLFLYAFSANAQTWNVADDFSLLNNPSGAWSYGYRNIVSTNTLNLMPAASVVPDIVTGLPTQFWFYTGEGSAGLPSVGYNPTTDQFGGPLVPLAPGELMIHPGNNAATSNLLCVVRWTAPVSGVYSINSQFIGLDRRGLDVTTFVVKNGALEMSQALLGFDSFSEYIAEGFLSAGDTLDFLVSNNGTLGDKDWTRLDVNIVAVAVPEPSSAFVLFSLSVVIVTGIVRRKVTIARQKGVERITEKTAPGRRLPRLSSVCPFATVPRNGSPLV